MDQLRDLADDRLFRGCVYCGGTPDTRDHVPSKIFLDEPFPTELPVVGACKECNNGFSGDEEYVACLVECALLGTVVPELHRREKVAKILKHSPALQARLAAARNDADEQVSYSVESERLRKVLLKLTKGHAMFELSWFADKEPASLWWSPLVSLTEEQCSAFEEAPSPSMLGEIGSRATQRITVLQAKLIGSDGREYVANLVLNDWVDVQEDRYRYLATDRDGSIRVRVVLGEYLACEAVWER
ncbi:hypothetical protein [Pinirhizobacter soli]|uniref:hypothetical protein n=1 Tax=Pinirhizobacter soli TaxID=2786953 RepID=UPI00202A2DBF|nr:hypothetical protein [Pinirhizobacter soli]